MWIFISELQLYHKESVVYEIGAGVYYLRQIVGELDGDQETHAYGCVYIHIHYM